ncbi:fatty acid-binding protein DegV [Gemmiger sp. An120]|uniref:DegV family protein n=1 Tax=Gemmiger sp. An120 TaxID=1965549 RepID=UPI000B3961D5|nr:DegV family protein [Gemmiger sp. An120]OUQ41575.1 fatty acid-binding protein DegV [Gemmiger sp. An120]HIX32717.1 DegV family protein [Candidatus Gemmiger avium]
MAEYVIFTDSTTDLTPELVAEMDVQVLPMRFMLDGKEYRNYPDNRELSPKEFYDKLRAGSMSTTSQINSVAFIEAFTPVLEAGKDILYVAFSSGLSGTYQSACLAAEDLREQFPERTIECVDTLQASMGEGLVAYAAAMLKKDGMSLAELAAWLRENVQRFCAWFTVDDLMFLKRGGRLSGVAAVAGTLLGIKPVLHVDPDGHLIAMEKVRGRKASLDGLVRHFETSAENHADQTVFISHGDCLEDCQYVADKIKAFGVKRICIGTIGPVIGAHSGPGTVALFFTGSPR